MRITNGTQWTVEAIEIDADGAIVNEFGKVAPNSMREIRIAIYVGHMGGGECRKPMDRPITLLEANGKNQDGDGVFVISRESPVEIRATEKGNQLMFCVA